VVGGWTQRDDGDVVFRLLEEVDRPALARIEDERDLLREWLGDVRLKPRFPTPLHRALRASG
jgi:hypothetical protein